MNASNASTKKTHSANKIPFTFRVADKEETNCAPVEVRSSVSLPITKSDLHDTRKKIQKRKTYSVLNQRIRNSEKYNKCADSSSDSEPETICKKPFCFHQPGLIESLNYDEKYEKIINNRPSNNATGDDGCCNINMKQCLGDELMEELTKWRVEESCPSSQLMQVYPLWLPHLLTKGLTRSPREEMTKRSLFDETATTSSAGKVDNEAYRTEPPKSPVIPEYQSKNKKWGIKKRSTKSGEIKVVVENKTFLIKRELLVQHSLAFRKALPNKDPHPVAVTLTDISKYYFAYVKDWMNGKSEVVTRSNAAGVLDVATKLEMPELYAICERALRTRAGLDEADEDKKSGDKSKKEKGDETSSKDSKSSDEESEKRRVREEREREKEESERRRVKEEREREKEEKKKEREKEKRRKEEERERLREEKEEERERLREEKEEERERLKEEKEEERERLKEEKEEEKARKKREKEEEKARKKEEKANAASSSGSDAESEKGKGKKTKEEKKKIKEEEKKRKEEEKEEKKRRKKAASETSDEVKSDKTNKTDKSKGKDKDKDKSKDKDKDKDKKKKKEKEKEKKKTKKEKEKDKKEKEKKKEKGKEKDESSSTSSEEECEEDECEDVMAAWRRRCKLASTVTWTIDPDCEVHHEMLEGKRDEYEQRQKQEEEEQESERHPPKQTFLPPKRPLKSKKAMCRCLSYATEDTKSNVSSNKKITFDDEQGEDIVKIVSGCTSVAVQKETAMKHSRRLRKLLSVGDENCDIRPTSITIPKVDEDALYDVGAYLNGAVLCLNSKNVKHILEIAEKLDMSVLRHKCRRYQLEVDEGCARPMEVRVEDDIRSACSVMEDPCTFDKDDDDEEEDEEEEEAEEEEVEVEEKKVEKPVRSNVEKSMSVNSIKSSLKSLKLPVKSKMIVGEIDDIAQLAKLAQFAKLDQKLDQIDEIKVELNENKQPIVLIKMKSKSQNVDDETDNGKCKCKSKSQDVDDETDNDKCKYKSQKFVDHATSTCSGQKSASTVECKRKPKKRKAKKMSKCSETVSSSTQCSTQTSATSSSESSSKCDSEYSSPDEEEPPECKKVPLLDTVCQLFGWKKSVAASASLCQLDSCKKAKENLLRMTKCLLNHDNIVLGESFCGGNEFTQSRVGNSAGLKFPFDANKLHWVIEDSAPFCHAFCASVFFKGKLYVSGGRAVCGNCTTCEAVPDIWRFDRHELKWHHLGCMAYSRIHHSAIVFQSSIYFIGGLDEKLCTLSSVEKMCIKDDSINLTQVAPLSVARAGVACAVNGDLLFVAGGLSKYALQQHGFHVLDVLECYDPRSTRWHKLTSMRIPRAFATMISSKKGLHVIGGITSVNKIDSSLEAVRSVSEVDIYGDESCITQHLNMPRYAASAVIHDGRLYVFGGIELETGSYISIVERFSPTSQKWVLANDEFSIQLK